MIGVKTVIMEYVNYRRLLAGLDLGSADIASILLIFGPL